MCRSIVQKAEGGAYGDLSVYLVTWNPQQATLEASLGGKITFDEARVFIDETLGHIERVQDSLKNVVIDYSKASSFDDGVSNLIAELHEACHTRDSVKVTIEARDEEQLVRLIDLRILHVLEGREEYRVTGLSA